MATAESSPQQQLAIISSLSRSIEESVNKSIPVKMLIREGAAQKTIEQIIALMISKSASMLSVGGNIQPHHTMEIASMLISEFPLCSLDDFQIMLQRGITSKYGKILRFDISVIFTWAREYMIEWAEAKEKLLAKEKSVQKNKPEDIDNETSGLVSEFINNLSESKKVTSVSIQEIWENGKERPRKKIAEAPVREEFIVGDKCPYCEDGCSNCNQGKINIVRVNAESYEEAEKMYKLSKSKK